MEVESKRTLRGDTVELHDINNWTDEAVMEKGVEYTWQLKHGELVPRQKAEVEKLLGRVVFEITMRRYEYDDLEAQFNLPAYEA